VGEQYIDLFAAGAYGLNARLLQALAAPSFGWLFYVLAASGIVASIVQSALEGGSHLWIRHLATVAVASVLIQLPQRIDLTELTYAAPGRIESVVGTRTGAAPHLTYLTERFGAAVAARLRRFLHQAPRLAVPSVAAQVEELATDPATLSDPQLKANLWIWRQAIVPRLLAQQPALAAQLRQAALIPDLLDPAPSLDAFVGSEPARRGSALRAALAASGADLAPMAADLAPLVAQSASAAGAVPWSADPGGAWVRLQFAARPPPTPDPPLLASLDYGDAVLRGTSLADSMIAALPSGAQPLQVASLAQLHELLGRSILYAAGASYLDDDARLATLGSLCQRLGDEACRNSQASLIQTSQALVVPPADPYNSSGWTTLFKQPLATLLLALTSLMLAALSSIVVSVLPFLLGVAKAIAILMSSVGVWMLLWPGRLRDALSWMVLPVAFVSLWAVLFNLWADIESFLSAIASSVGHSEQGSLSAGRIMSIGISLGYLGLPMIALSVLSGSPWRALTNASGHLESAFLMAWRTRHAMVSFGRRWLTSSPLARRWNQRVYRAVGLGSLKAARAPVPRARRPAPAGGAAPAAVARGRAPPRSSRPGQASPGQVKLDLPDAGPHN